MSRHNDWQVLYTISLCMLCMNTANHVSLTISIHVWSGNVWLDIINRLVYSVLLLLFAYKVVRGAVVSVSSLPARQWFLTALPAILGNIVMFLYNAYSEQNNRFLLRQMDALESGRKKLHH